MKLVKGALIAVAAGSLFAAACKKEDKPADNQPASKQPDQGAAKKADPGATTPTAAEKPAEKVAKVDCYGVNECKGQSTCKTDKHGCGGQNECKGQGVLVMTEGECETKGGKITQRY